MKSRQVKSPENSPSPPRQGAGAVPGSGFDMWVLMDNAHFAIARSRFLEISQFDLTKEQAQVLYVLQVFGGSATQTQIADFTMRQHHSVSTLVNRMCKEGLVRKEKDPAGRGFRIFVTKKGKDKYARVTKNSVEMIFSSLSPAEKKSSPRTWASCSRRRATCSGWTTSRLS
ncbi:MAG: MarR family winged helix-turn-helix transcriptional regulator [Chloroflexota bacterium]